MSQANRHVVFSRLRMSRPRSLVNLSASPRPLLDASATLAVGSAGGLARCLYRRKGRAAISIFPVSPWSSQAPKPTGRKHKLSRYTYMVAKKLGD
ncbi:unnamed protein product [Urochloa humidicola]